MPIADVDPERVQQRLADLLPTRFDDVMVTPERLRDLMTREDSQVGDVLTDPSVAANIPCHNCGAPMGRESTCQACGTLRPRSHGHPHDDGDSEAEPASYACCRHCGTPNPKGRELCLSCGTRNEAEA